MRILTKMSCSYSDNRLIFPDNASPHTMKDATRRALAHSILLHFPSLPPYYNILVFLFISILSFLINLSAFLLYNLRPRHSPVSMNS